MGSRTENSLRNLKFNLFGQCLYIFITFVSRTIFVHVLGSVYLGINGLFSNIINFLNLAELGVSSAITFSLYEPLLINDTDRLSSIMCLYKRIYRFVGCIVLVVGIGLTPFIRKFITSETEIELIELYYVLCVINAAVSYLFSYKSTLLEADQKQYVNAIFQYVFLIMQNIVQIIAIFATHNFTVYLIIQICSTIGVNIAISIYADKIYPFLRKSVNKKLDSEVIECIKRNVCGSFCHKIGTAFVNSTDNILISKFVNIVYVGYYSNYYMVLSALNIIISRFFASITASVGNLGAEKNLNLLKSTFNKVFFLNFWMYAFSTVCCVCLFQNFIGIWVGEGMLLDVSVLIVILINFYLNGMRKTVLTFKDALGLYWYDRFKPIVESVINLGVSILLAVKIGFIGIFIGTMISCITTSLWIEPYVLCKYGFKNEGLTICSYFMHFIKYTLLLLVDLIVCLCIVKYIHIGGIWGFAVRTVSVVVLSNIVLVAFLFKSDNFKWFKELLISLIKKHLV